MAKLNPLGLSRKDEKLMRTILPERGNMVISSDASSGEPTVTTHYSGDKNYRMACFDMVGKAPYYEHGILQIDDIYLQVASVSPIGRAAVEELWSRDWSGKTFAQQWLEDSDVIKKAYKDGRNFHKMLALALAYGCGAQKMVDASYEKGFKLDLNTAKQFKGAYWELYKDVKRFATQCSNQVKRDGYIVNEFGYRGVPDGHRAYNFFIQSSVSGVLHIYTRYLMNLAPYAVYRVCIHDEIVLEIPEDRIEEFKTAKEQAEKMVNETLEWTVNLRFGLASGLDWFEAK